MNGGGNHADVPVGIPSFKHQLIGFACHEIRRCINHHERGGYRISGNDLKRSASCDVA